MSLVKNTPQISAKIRQSLNRRCRLRQQMRTFAGGNHDRCCIGQHYWVLLGLYNELINLLDREMATFKPCRQNHCHLQAQADALTKLCYQYFFSVLEVFRAQQQPTEWALSIELAGYLGLEHQDSENHYYLHAKEIARLAALINETIMDSLIRVSADYPEPDAAADQLPAIARLLQHCGYTHLASVPGEGFDDEHYRAEYWVKRHRFNLPELHLAVSDAPTRKRAVLRYRNSKRLWYCGHCLGRDFARYCNLEELSS
jgi:hypothetical protein